MYFVKRTSRSFFTSHRKNREGRRRKEKWKKSELAGGRARRRKKEGEKEKENQINFPVPLIGDKKVFLY